MTSKEKLISLVSALEVIGETSIKKDVVKQYKEDILKDLEILEIIKKHCDFSLWKDVLSIMPKEEYRFDYEDDVYTSVNISNEEDRKAIKEWLDA